MAVGRLGGHALRFHKRGRDGSAKADAFATGRAGDVVHGVIYEMTASAKVELDRHEGLGSGYRERRVAIECEDDGAVAAWVYQAEAAHVDDALRPFTWYRALVVAGARHHGFGDDYVAAVEAVEAADDPDRERHAREMRVLTGRG